MKGLCFCSHVRGPCSLIPFSLLPHSPHPEALALISRTAALSLARRLFLLSAFQGAVQDTLPNGLAVCLARALPALTVRRE